MPSKLIASSALILALALAALPGVADSEPVLPPPALPEDAFRDLTVGYGQVAAVVRPSGRAASLRSASHLAPGAPLIDVGPASAAAIPLKRPSVAVGAAAPGRIWNTPRYSVTGEATWYDNGTTAMRLPRGTVVVICGDGGCVERVITDYGPGIPRRVVDLMPGDFVAVCGCPLWRGITKVTVRIY